VCDVLKESHSATSSVHYWWKSKHTSRGIYSLNDSRRNKVQRLHRLLLNLGENCINLARKMNCNHMY